MMSLSMIESITRSAARKAAKEKKLPVMFSQRMIDAMRGGDYSRFGIVPFLGTHLPKGWKRVSLQPEADAGERGVYMGDNKGFGAYFVDASGFGGENEPALSVRQFANKLSPDFAYAIVEAGQFQVKIGVYAIKA